MTVVDLNAVRAGLVGAVDETVNPTDLRLWLWIDGRGRR